jgi:hypothetical protein
MALKIGGRDEDKRGRRRRLTDIPSGWNGSYAVEMGNNSNQITKTCKADMRFKYAGGELEAIEKAKDRRASDLRESYPSHSSNTSA